MSYKKSKFHIKFLATITHFWLGIENLAISANWNMWVLCWGLFRIFVGDG
jgi:hypothetical protein